MSAAPQTTPAKDASVMEREVLWTGIGGQGVQLAAKVFALAATREDLKVMSLGTYGGTMRGGNTDATVVVARDRITSPPMVSSAWAALVTHPRYFDPIRGKLRADGVVFVDGDLLEGPLGETAATIEPIAATQIARELDAPKAAALVLLGAFAAATRIVGPEALSQAMAESLPPYRSEFLEANRRALAAGADAIAGDPSAYDAYLAWPGDES